MRAACRSLLLLLADSVVLRQGFVLVPAPCSLPRQFVDALSLTASCRELHLFGSDTGLVGVSHSLASSASPLALSSARPVFCVSSSATRVDTGWWGLRTFAFSRRRLQSPVSCVFVVLRVERRKGRACVEWGRRVRRGVVSVAAGPLPASCVCARDVYASEATEGAKGRRILAPEGGVAPYFVLVSYNGWSGRFERSPICFSDRSAPGRLSVAVSSVNRTRGCGLPGSTTATEI